MSFPAGAVTLQQRCSNVTSKCCPHVVSTLQMWIIVTIFFNVITTSQKYYQKCNSNTIKNGNQQERFTNGSVLITGIFSDEMENFLTWKCWNIVLCTNTFGILPHKTKCTRNMSPDFSCFSFPNTSRNVGHFCFHKRLFPNYFLNFNFFVWKTFFRLKPSLKIGQNHYPKSLHECLKKVLQSDALTLLQRVWKGQFQL